MDNDNHIIRQQKQAPKELSKKSLSSDPDVGCVSFLLIFALLVGRQEVGKSLLHIHWAYYSYIYLYIYIAI